MAMLNSLFSLDDGRLLFYKLESFVFAIRFNIAASSFLFETCFRLDYFRNFTFLRMVIFVHNPFPSGPDKHYSILDDENKSSDEICGTTNGSVEFNRRGQCLAYCFHLVLLEIHRVKKPCRKSGKIKFDSHEQAAIRAGEILHHDHNATEFLRTYKCDFCGKWHLTHK